MAVLRFAAALALGRLQRLADAALLPATELRIDGPPPEPVQADGDIIARLPATIEIAAASLEIFVP